MYNEEQIAEIEKLAASYLNIEEIATIIGVEFYNFQEDLKLNKKLNQAFLRGRLKTKAQIQENIMELAMRDSPIAQKMAIDIINKIENLEYGWKIS